MKKDIILELVETTINGNSIKNNRTYINMLNRIKKADIQNHYLNNNILCGTKIEMIKQIAGMY